MLMFTVFYPATSIRRTLSRLRPGLGRRSSGSNVRTSRDLISQTRPSQYMSSSRMRNASQTIQPGGGGGVPFSLLPSFLSRLDDSDDDEALLRCRQFSSYSESRQILRPSISRTVSSHRTLASTERGAGRK